MPKRPQTGQASLFESEGITRVTSSDLKIKRPYDHAQLFLGTSAFTANGWAGVFYPPGMKQTEYLAHYARTFRTVEIDSTYYGPPAASTVENWYRKTPPDFIFAAKVPQSITHHKMLLECDAELAEFMERITLLKEKLGPLLFQFPRFDKFQFKAGKNFISRLRPFLKTLPPANRYVVEIRNPTWLRTELSETLREFNVALALTDTSFMPRPWELDEPLDLVTADFAYVRWLGDRKDIETQTMTWDKTIIDRTADLKHWVALSRKIVAERKIKHLFLFGNNHYQGHGPATVRNFWRLWNDNHV
jgi:uncharacterized protein YecE (DUF72 family)